jgi:hypothetical protein
MSAHRPKGEGYRYLIKPGGPHPPTSVTQLLAAGVFREYLQHQLGHGDAQMTAHYARWRSPHYCEPLNLKPGEVPADLLARVGEGEVSRPEELLH